MGHLSSIAGMSCSAMFLVLALPINAQPILPASDGTGTIVTPNGNEFLINGGTQAGANLFHSFQQFGLDTNQIATFLATPELQNILGRVTGGDPSVINGLLQVTGGSPNLYLLNPAGIIFGNNASLNIPASFTATTASGIGFGGWGDGGMGGWFNAYGANNYSTLIGNPTAFTFSPSPHPLTPSSPYPPTPSSLINAGTLTVKPGQSLNLIGGTVINTGTLSAPGGSITLLSVPNSSLVRLSQPGSLLRLEIDSSGLCNGCNGLLSNQPSAISGTPSVATLPQLLTGSGLAAEATGLSVDVDGTVRLVATNTVIPQTAGTTIVSGTIDASQMDPSQPPLIKGGLPDPEPPLSRGAGGIVQVLGDRVGLFSTTINASGQDGGGTVLIGGDYKGQGTVPNAQVTVVDSRSMIFADAGQTGNGGKVVLWADGLTRFSGAINARGSSTLPNSALQTPHSVPSNGGFVEVSGKQQLSFAGTVDLSAANGNLGSLLLDPLNITISASPSAPAGPGGVDDQFLTTTPGSILTGDFPGIDITLNAAVLEGQAAAITLEATNNITIDTGLSLTFVPGGAITFTAGGVFSMDPFQTITARGDTANNGRDITISAASITVGGIDTAIDAAGNATNAGAIRLVSSGGDITTGTLNASVINGDGAAGNITLSVTGGTGAINTAFLLASAVSGAGGNVSLAANSIAVSGGIDTSVNDFFGIADPNAGSIQILSSGGDITASNLNTDVINGAGVAGNITLSVTGGLGNINTTAGSLSAFGANNSGGTISLTAQGGNITTGAIQTASNTTLPGATGGNITLQTIGNGFINTTGGELLSRAVNLGNRGGLITLTTVDGNIITGNLTSGSAGFDSLGNDIVLTATGAGAIDTTGGTILSGSGSGSGIINLTTNTGTITVGELNSASPVGGTISVTAGNGSIAFNGAVTTGGGNLDATATAATGNGITVANTLSTGDGNITLTGTAGGITFTNGVLITTGGNITTTNGNITIAGFGSPVGTGTNNLGILQNGGSSITTTGTGAITLNGTAGTGTASLSGVVLAGTGTRIATANGAIAITGTGGGGATATSFNYGVSLDDFFVLTTTDGAISVTGTGGAGTGIQNFGITQSFSATTTATGTGTVTFNGTGGTGDNGAGIFIDNGGITTNSGNVTLTGTTPSGGADGDGVRLGFTNGNVTSTSGTISITGTNTNPVGDGSGVDLRSPVDAGTGNITIVGTSASSGVNANAVNVSSNVTTTSGTITIAGNNTNASSDARGIFISGNLTATAGNITLTGTSAGNGTVATGIELTDSGAITAGNNIILSGNTTNPAGSGDGLLIAGDVFSATAAGSIFLTGISTGTSDARGIDIATTGNVAASGGAITLRGINNNPNTNAALRVSGTIGNATSLGTISFIANEITLNPVAVVRGAGSLILQPTTRQRDVVIGGTSDAGPSSLDLTAADLSTLQDGFSDITIGRSDSTGNTTLNTYAFQDPVTIAGATTLTGADTPTTWTLTGATSGTLSGFAAPVSFTNVTNLVGGSNNDTFVFNDGVIVAGTIDGGAGIDTLDYSVFKSPVTIDLGTLTSIEAAIGNGMNTTLIASSVGNTFNLTGVNSGTVNGFQFTNVQTLRGGSGNDTIQFNGGTLTKFSGGGNLTLIGDQITIAGTVDGSGDLTFQSITPNRPIQLGGSAAIGDVLFLSTDLFSSLLNGFNQITIGNPTTPVTIAGDVTVQDPFVVQASEIAFTAGRITGFDDASLSFTATQSLTMGNLKTSAQAITLTAPSIQTGDLLSNGGDISIIAQTTITTGAIDSSNLSGEGYGGDGGNVFIDPSGDVQVTSINAQGGSGSLGGTVDITTASLFRATGSFTDQNGVLSSISTAGSAGGGSITLRHGGSGTTPFVVGDATANGTTAAITTGSDSIQPTFTIPVPPGTFTSGAIGIITPEPPIVLPPPIPPVNPPLPANPASPPPLENPANPPSSPTANNPNEDFLPTEPPKPIDFNLNSPLSLFDPDVTNLDNAYSQEYQAYLGEADPIPNVTVELSRRILAGIQQAAGVKPALIYVSFVPSVGSTGQAPNNQNTSSSSLVSRPSSFVPTSSSQGQLTNDQGQMTKNQGAQPKNENQWESNSQGFVFNRLAIEPTDRSQARQDSDELEILVVTTGDRVIRKRLPGVTRAQVLAMANEFRLTVTDTSSNEYLKPAQQLYQWTIAPIQADLQQQEIDNLVFILDPGLRSLPLAAMHDGKQFLVETYSVGMMPSLALTDTTYVNLQNSSVLAMGASVFKEQNPLPAVPQELELIKAARRGTSFLNEDFTLANLKAARSRIPYSIVHLATHGEFKAGDLSQSYIQFWDSRLRLDQIRTLGFNNPKVELLVLSACRTALGNEEAELGFAGLAFKAGVRTVLGSLWYVSDEGTLGLMGEFYKQLESAPIRAEALRQAQLSLIQGVTSTDGTLPPNPAATVTNATSVNSETKDLAHPYYWAAFTMVGNPW